MIPYEGLISWCPRVTLDHGYLIDAHDESHFPHTLEMTSYEMMIGQVWRALINVFCLNPFCF